MSRPDDLLVVAPQRDTREAINFRELMDGRWYGFRLAWNVRDRRWYLDVSADTGAPIVRGIAVESQINLLGGIRRDTLPAGQMLVDDAEGLDRRPDRFGWSTFARLWYRPASVVALASGTTSEVR